MSRGIARERQVKLLLLAEGWWVVRAAGSMGDADLVALKAGETPLMVEVKSDVAGPFANFRPGDREDLRRAAKVAGATPTLCWWPPRKPPKWIPESDWPGVRAVTPMGPEPKRRVAA
jgi:Holliday junction resolvase